MSKEHDSQKDAVVIVAYDSSWPSLAGQEIRNLRSVIDDENFIDIQHIGSTSIPNAMAKPIIDIYIGVRSIDKAKQDYVNPITSLGYSYWDENPNPNKLFFVKGMPPFGKQRTHHVHVVKHNSNYWRDRIAFRDYLKKHPEEVLIYNKLKMKLAQEYRYDREAYTDNKNTYITSILKKAGIDDGGER